MNDQQRRKLMLSLIVVLAGIWLFIPINVGTDSSKQQSADSKPAKSDESAADFHQTTRPGHNKSRRNSLTSLPVSWAQTLGGSCVNCHVNITPAHTKQALKCIDCHGGNDRVVTGPNPNIRDKNLMAQAHVQPKDPRFFWPNGIADRFAGAPGKGDTEFDAFNNNLDPVDNTSRVGLLIDNEYNRDLNYVRFINPSDYRVAMVSCGSLSPAETSVGLCHGTEVTTIRKWIMTTNQGQFATATYANHAPVGATNANPLGTNPTMREDPRDGEMTITFNYDDIDAAYDRASNQFDSAQLLRIARQDDDPFNDTFEATGAPLVDRDGRERTVVHGGDTPPGRPQTTRLRGIGGNRLIPQAVPRAQKMLLPWLRRDSKFNPEDPTSSLIKTVLNVFGFQNVEGHQPIDAGFNAVRAFDPVLFPDVNQNFPFPFDDNLPDRIPLAQSRQTAVAQANLEFVPPNPFNRSRNSGCSSCHMLYRADGKNEEPFDRTVRDNGRNISTSPFRGMNEDKGERGYPAIHQLTTKIPTNQCGICHVFTTRVDVAFKGTFEIENNNFNFRWSTTADANNNNVPLRYTSRRGSRINIFDNLATVDQNGTRVINDGEAVTEDRNNNGELDSGEDRNNNGMLDIPDRLQRSDAQDGRQMRIMYGGASGAVRLMDIHLERGMECIDCHFFQDLHGDGNIYTRNWDAIEIECVDCHGTARKLATLKTSGPNGGNDLTKALDENGVPFFEKQADGSRIQRSRVHDGRSWRIPQVKESIKEGGPHFNRDAFEAHNVRSLSNPKEFAHTTRTSREFGKLECYSCHSAAQPQCFACHYQQEYFPLPNPANTSPLTGEVRRPDQQQMEIWMGEKFVPFPNFFFFGIVRSPFILGINGNTEFNKISPFRSIMEINFSVGGPNGDTLVHNTSFTATTHDLVTGDRPRSGSTLNPYMPHVVRTKETKDCDMCHTLRDGDGNVMNNHILAATMGLGSGRYRDLGDWVFAPLQGPNPGLLMMDIKKEEAVIKVETDAPQKRGDTTPVTQAQINQAKKLANNVFPGFTVDNNANNQTKLRKVEFDGTEDGATFTDPRDTALIRNYTAKDHAIRGADLAFVADGAGGLKIVLVTARDGAQITRTERPDLGAQAAAQAEIVRKNLGPTIVAQVATANARGVDVISPDLSDEFVYVADGEAGAKIVYIHEIFTAGPQLVGQVDTPGFANKVRIAGNFLYVADGPEGLAVIDVTNKNNPVRVTNVATNGDARDVAIFGTFAFVANGGGGLAVIDIGDERNPRLVSQYTAGGVINDARGIDYADNRAYIADGVNGLRIVDITKPAAPVLLGTINMGENGVPINDAESVEMATVPFNTFAMVSDGANGLRAINVTDHMDIRERLHPNTGAFPRSDIDNIFQSNFELSLALRDPLTPFNRANLRLPGSLANPPVEVITFPLRPGQRILGIAPARQLDKETDQSGRTLRDNTAVGASALSRELMDRMRNVNVVIEPGTVDDNGNGLGNIIFQSATRLPATRGATLATIEPEQSGGRWRFAAFNLVTLSMAAAMAATLLLLIRRHSRRRKTNATKI